MAVLVAVDDGANIGEFVIDDEVHGFGDLSFACFAVADDAVDSSVKVVEAGGFGDACGDGEPLPERAGGGVEEINAFHWVWVSVEDGVPFSECGEVVGGEFFAIVRFADHDTEGCHGGVDGGDGVSLREDEAVTCWVVWVVWRPAHGGVHEGGDDVSDAHGTGGVTGA